MVSDGSASTVYDVNDSGFPTSTYSTTKGLRARLADGREHNCALSEWFVRSDFDRDTSSLMSQPISILAQNGNE
jgi:hypothetical protein